MNVREHPRVFRALFVNVHGCSRVGAVEHRLALRAKVFWPTVDPWIS